MENQRRFQRVRPVAKTGTIFVDARSPATACNVIDVSAGGACLEVHGSDAVPKKFILSHAGVKKTCRVVWQKGRRVGVTF